LSEDKSSSISDHYHEKAYLRKASKHVHICIHPFKNKTKAHSLNTDTNMLCLYQMLQHDTWLKSEQYSSISLINAISSRAFSQAVSFKMAFPMSRGITHQALAPHL